MHKATLTLTRRIPLSDERETFEHTLEDDRVEIFYARLSGVVDGYVGGTNPFGNAIVGIKIEKD